MSKLLNVMVFILFTYPVGIVMGMNFWLFRFFGILKVMEFILLKKGNFVIQ